MPRSRHTGKYEDVLEEYGKEGFGIPSKAPHVGSFPLYPIGRARYALVLIASPSYDGKEAQREQIRKRALKAHPSLKSFWKEREETINNRMSGEMRMAANPASTYTGYDGNWKSQSRKKLSDRIERELFSPLHKEKARRIAELLELFPPPSSTYVYVNEPVLFREETRRNLTNYIISLARREGEEGFLFEEIRPGTFQPKDRLSENVQPVIDFVAEHYLNTERRAAEKKKGRSVNWDARDNPSGEKQIVLRSESREELEALVPVAVDALLEMGADSVEVSPVERDVPRGAGLHFIHYKVRFTVEGLGRGRRFSRGHRQQFREIVLALLPMQVGTPSFQDATGGGFEALMGEPLPGFRTRGKMPDSKRTARAKARSRARRKTPRRLNSRR